MNTVDRISGLMLVVNGQPTPLADLSWAKYAPCGCLVAVTLAECDSAHLLPTEDAAWASMYEDHDPAMIGEDKARGYTMRLMRRGEAVAGFAGKCEHDRSAWQRDESATDGYHWVVSRGRPTRRTDRAHLAPVDEECSKPACGGSGRKQWWDIGERPWRAVHEHRLCAACVRFRDAAKVGAA